MTPLVPLKLAVSAGIDADPASSRRGTILRVPALDICKYFAHLVMEGVGIVPVLGGKQLKLEGLCDLSRAIYISAFSAASVCISVHQQIH